MEPAILLKEHKFNQLMQWFNLCEKLPDDSFTALANILEITPHALIQILKLIYEKSSGHNLKFYLLNDELDMSTQYMYAHTINQLLQPGRLLHGKLTYLHPDKWMCFMQTLHDVVHDPNPSSFRLDYEKYVDCVSRVSEETIPPPHREMAMEDEEDERDNIGLGGIAQPMMSQKKLAKESAKKEIKELIRTMLMIKVPRPMLFAKLTHHDETLEQTIATHIAALKQRITAYLSSKTINRTVVKKLYEDYLSMFERTDQRIVDDRYWSDDVTQEQKDKIRIENSILDALAKFCGIKTGGKKSRSKKRGLHRRKKSSHKKRK